MNRNKRFDLHFSVVTSFVFIIPMSYTPISPPKPALILTIQEKREDLFCYSLKSGIWKSLVKMNMKKQYSRYDVM